MKSTTYALDGLWRPLLRDLGISSAQVLRRAALPVDLLEGGTTRLESDEFHRFWQALDDHLADPLLPLRVMSALRSECFSPPLFAALSSPNWWVAMQRIARYKALVAPLRIELSETHERMKVHLIWPLAGLRPPISLVVTELLFMLSLARLGTREKIRPLAIGTTSLPEQPEAYRDFLGGSWQKSSRHRLELSRADALRPFLTASEGLWAAFEPELQTRLAHLDASIPWAQRVRAQLLEALPGGGLDLDAVANRLGQSRRSLQRHLRAEGLSFQQLLQHTREALARHYLQSTDLSTAEISFLLGFEEPNSFFRACRAWTGQSPDQLRQQSKS